MADTTPSLQAPETLPALLEEERRQTGVAFDLLSPEIRTNPYPLFHALRTKDPVHWSSVLGGWLLTRYQDVQTFIRQPGLSKDFRQARRGPLGNIGLADTAGEAQSMLRADPPKHTRLRSLVSKAFTPRAVEALRPRIQSIAEELLDVVDGEDTFDLMRDFADPLPVIVIAELLGVSPEDREQFKAWSTDLVLGLGAFSSAEVRARREAANAQLVDYFRGVAQERRHHPRADLISALLAAEEAGDRLTEQEFLATCVLLLVAGNETTTNLISNGMLALLQHPEQVRLLQGDAALIGQAVEELLRFDSPVQLFQRVTTTDVEIADTRIESGTMVIPLLGAANRDPAVFDNPDALDITRTGASHLSFGHGIHYCLGASLARTEASIAIPTLLRRFPHLGLAPAPPERRPSLALRGLRTLPVVSNA